MHFKLVAASSLVTVALGVFSAVGSAAVAPQDTQSQWSGVFTVR